ncbi:MAG: MATE family efflux transporter [Immundisolibacteraceae bacterium]|nr:MATE family efflux transporter [Immundisolibacteraceae bacterium]
MLRPHDEDKKTSLNRRFWGLAVPLILSNISVALLGLVDTGVTGHLDGSHFLGGVAIGGTVFSFLYWGFNFLRMGTGGLSAQALGRNDHQAMRSVLLQAIFLALTISVLLVALRQPIIDFALALIAPSEAVAEQARSYFAVRIWATPAALCNFAMLGWFIGQQNVRASLYLLLLINSVNILLDFWLVVGLGWGVEGVALASVIAEFAGLSLAVVLVSTRLKSYPGDWDWSVLRKRSAMAGLLQTHQHLFVRTMLLLGVFTFFSAQAARLGDTVIAANAVMMNFYLLASFALDGLAHAAEALVGEAVGAKNGAYLRRVIRLALTWGLVVSGLFALFYLAGGRWLYQLMTDLPQVRDLLVVLLPWAILLPVTSVHGFIYDGIYTGGTWTQQMRNTMFFSVFMVYLPCWYLTQSLAVHGLWLAFVLFNISRGMTMSWIMRSRILPELKI